MNTPNDLTPELPAWPAPPPTPVQPSGLFMGRFGLRAGWGISIYLVITITLVIFCSLCVMAATGKLKSTILEAQKTKAAQAQAKAAHSQAVPSAAPKPPHEEKPGAGIINEALQFLCTLIAAFLLSKIERRKLSVYGIGPSRIRDALPGAIWGIVSLSALVGILYAAHLLVFDNVALTLPAALRFGTEWLLAFLFVGFFEEYLFRGYIQHALTRGFFGLAERIAPDNPRPTAFLLASVVSSIIFFVAHLGNEGETAAGLFAVFLAGVVFTYALWRTGSLWWGIGFHTTWDWAQSFLYGTPDSGSLSAHRLLNTHGAGNPFWSGGSDGPEGSALVLPILALVLIAIRFTPRGEQPSLEQLPPTDTAEPQAIAA